MPMPEQITIDGVTQAKSWSQIINDWETASLSARDAEIDSLLGLLRKSGNYNGMQSLVRQAHNYWTPRHWENPPFELGTTDEEHMVYPWLFGVMENILAIATPENIRVRALPLGDNMSQFSAFANSLLAEEFEELKMDARIRELAFRAKHYGAQFVFQGMNRYGGNLNLKRTLEFCDPLSILWEPGAEKLEDSKYIIWKRWSPIAQVKRQYGITTEVKPKELEDKFSTPQTVQGTTGKSVNSESLKLRCVETIVYFKDSTQTVADAKTVIGRIAAKLGVPVDSIPQTPEVGGAINQMLATDKYPFGRLVCLVNDDKVFDEPNPFTHQANPFHLLVNHAVPGCLWGMPEWLANGDVQTVMNESVTGQVRSARLGFGKSAYKPSALKDPTQKANLENSNPALTVQLNDDAPENWHSVINLGGNNQQYAETVRTAISLGDRISGVNDALRGQPNSNITSGIQAQTMTANATGRQQLFVQQLEQCIEGIGYEALYNGVQYRPDKDIIAIVSNAILYDEQGNPRTNFTLNEFKAMFTPAVKFKIKLQAQSGLPTDRAERFKMLREMLPMLSVMMNTDPDGVCEIVEMSDIPELQAWYDKRKAKMMLAAQMQAKNSPPPSAYAVNPPITQGQ